MYRVHQKLLTILGSTLVLVGISAASAHAQVVLQPASNAIIFRDHSSSITDDVDLHIATDDNMYLDSIHLYVSGATSISGDLALGNNVYLDNGKSINFGHGSAITEGMDMHISTDDFLYLDAPTRVIVQNDLSVGGNATVTGSVVADAFSGDGSDITNIDGQNIQDGSITEDKLAFALPGDLALKTSPNTFTQANTFQGNVTIQGASRHVLLHLGNDGDLQVDGHTTLGSSYHDDLTVNATSEFDAHAWFNGDVTLGDSGDDTLNVYANSTFQNDIGVNGTFYANSDVNLGTDSDNAITVNGRLYGYDGDPVTVGHYSDNSGLKVWGNTDLRGMLTVGGWGSDDSGISVLSGGLGVHSGGLWVDNTNTTDLLGDTNIGTTSANTLIVTSTSTFNNNVTLGSSNTDSLTVNSTASFAANATVHGTFIATGEVDLGNDSSDDVYVNGRLYGNDGDPVTVGHYSNMSGFKVWGNTDLRGAVQIGGWGSDIGPQPTFNVMNDGGDSVFAVGQNCGYDGGGCMTLGDDSYGATVTVQGRLYGYDGDPLTVGHHGDFANSGMLVWGRADLAGGAVVGKTWDNHDLIVHGNTNFDGNSTLGSASGDTLTVNSTSSFLNDVTLGSSSGDDLTVNSSAMFNSDVVLGSDSDNSITVEGRLYGYDGDPVTIGHHSDNSGLKVWGDTDLRGSLEVGGWGSDDTGIVVHNGDVVVSDGDFNLSGSSIIWGNEDVHGNLHAINGFTASGSSSLQGTTVTTLHATGNTTLDGTLSAGNTTVGSLTVNAGATFNAALTLSGVANFNSLSTFGGASTFNSTTTHNGAVTFTSTASFGSTVTATAGVDFSGASSLRIPVTASALVDGVTACASTGLITFSTNNTHMFVCDGVHWKQIALDSDL